MLYITGLKEGIVLDHIKAGMAMKIYRYMNLDKLDTEVAIIKIEGGLDRIDLDVLGYLDHAITVNIIRDDKIVEKRSLKLPRKITNVIHCKNPRCITSIEQELPHVFVLSDEEHEIYRCAYCEETYGTKVK